MNRLSSRLARVEQRVMPPDDRPTFELWCHVPGLPGTVENQKTHERMSQKALAKSPGYFTLRIGDKEVWR